MTDDGEERGELYQAFRRALRTAIGVVVLINITLWLGPNGPAAHRHTPTVSPAPAAPATVVAPTPCRALPVWYLRVY